MEKLKKIKSINGPVIEAEGDADFAMHEMVKIGNRALLGEVIKIEKRVAIIQVYEDTSGLKIGDRVVSTDAPLSVELGPRFDSVIFLMEFKDLLKL